MLKVFCHILLYKTDAETAVRCVESVTAQEGVDVLCAISDNGGASNDALMKCAAYQGTVVWTNEDNFGFCGGHNIAALRARRWGADFFVTLNPDVILTPGALSAMVESANSKSDIGLVTPKLLRADSKGTPIIPPMIDAAGMILTNTTRHFDRGSGDKDLGQLDQGEYVFGGTGACLMFSMKAVNALELSAGDLERDTTIVYPQMKKMPERIYLFDEAFFAYREDAEISWRAAKLGFKTWYEPKAVALHERNIKGTSRSNSFVNRLSVKNRFLLQATLLNSSNIFTKLCTCFRNLIVVLGVYTFERSSLPGLQEFTKLKSRAVARRRALESKVKAI